jgi:hypothetical protein
MNNAADNTDQRELGAVYPCAAARQFGQCWQIATAAPTRSSRVVSISRAWPRQAALGRSGVPAQTAATNASSGLNMVLSLERLAGLVG